MINNLILTLSKDKESKFIYSNGKKEALAPIKHRKSISSKDLNESINDYNKSNVNFSSQQDKHKEHGITEFISQQNVNKNIQVFSCKSRAGSTAYGTRKTNQDSYLAKTNILNIEDLSIFGVYDGHGKSFI